MMYHWLAVGIGAVAGVCTVVGNILSHYDYRDELAVWFRGIFWFQPDPALMMNAP